MSEVRKKEGDSSPMMQREKVKSQIKHDEECLRPNMDEFRGEKGYTSRNMSEGRSWYGYSSLDLMVETVIFLFMGKVRSKKGFSSQNMGKIRRDKGSSSSRNSGPSHDVAPVEASGGRVSGYPRTVITGTIMSMIINYIDQSKIVIIKFSEVFVVLSICYLVSFISSIHNDEWTSHSHSRVVNLLVHIYTALMMIHAFLRMILLNDCHSLSESLSLPLCIFLIVTVSFVCVMGYEAWKKPDVLSNKPDVLEHIRDYRSSVEMFESQTTTEEKNYNGTYDIKDYKEELSGPMILTVVLKSLIDTTFCNFMNQTTSDKEKNSLYNAAISFCFLTYIIGLISMLLNSLPPKVHSKAHREKVENALGVLNFIFIFVVIVTVVTMTACHLREYALLNAIPLLAGLAGLKYLNIVAVLLGVLLAAIIEGQSTSYGDMHKLSVDMCKLLVSMVLVSCLSHILATITQPTPRKPDPQQKVEHVD